jgi:hypothetical protein
VTDIRALLDGHVVEAVELRFSGDIPGPQSAPKQILDALYEVRRRLDRVEFLLSQAIRVRGKLRESNDAATAEVDDAWDSSIHTTRSAAVVRDDYTSAKERYAEANLATLDLRRTQRAAAAVLAHADTSVDLLRLSLRGLGDLRQELLTVLRTLQFESHLER